MDSLGINTLQKNELNNQKEASTVTPVHSKVVIEHHHDKETKCMDVIIY